MAEKKEKRIRGVDYWNLLGALKKIDDAKEVWQKWCRTTAKKLGLYLDEVNFVTGAISKQIVTVDADGSSKVETAVTDHIDQKHVDEGQAQFAKVEAVAKTAQRLLETTAKKYRTYEDCIDPKTGVITGDEIERVDPDDEDDKVVGTVPARDEEEAPDAKNDTEDQACET